MARREKLPLQMVNYLITQQHNGLKFITNKDENVAHKDGLKNS